jgi:tripartite-type tricarboxylate transporter receptor subunit TctC
MMIRYLAIAAAALIGSGTAASAQYPDRAITIVVGAAPGGGTDVQARILADRLTEKLGQRVLVENKAGAGGNIAQADIARATPDGYRIIMMAPAPAINHTLYETPGFDMLKDFKGIAMWADSPLLFVVNPKLPVNNLKELAAYSKANPNKLNYGNGVGFINQMVMELYKIEAGADIQFVPYQGMAPARTDVISGQIETTVDSIASSGPFVENGQLKGLAVTSKQRLPRFPTLPTVTEAGFPGLTRTTWYGLAGPAGMPDAVAQRLAKEIAAIQAEPETIKKIEASGATPLVMGAAEFHKFMIDDTNTWAKVIASAKMPKVK